MLKLQISLYLLLQISSLKLTISTEYSQPQEFFINCGSESGTNFTNNRAFVGDESDRTGKLSYGRSQSVKNENSSNDTPFLYRTARIYTKPSSFELEIAKTDTYIVRLHFFAFETPSFNLSNAEFNVSASGFSLLSEFSTRNTGNSLPIVEFLLSIPKGRLGIFFVPANSSSFAFVNAIEVFPAPEDFLSDSVPYVTSPAINASFKGLLSQVLKTVNRVNVGGQKISPENDTLWRTWVEDDGFLTSMSGFTVSPFHSGKLDYDSGSSSTYIAPDFVYKTARFSNDTINSSAFINFGFAFNESAPWILIRVHFCDIISAAIDRFRFTLLFHGKFETIVDPYKETRNLAAPFYSDFVLDSNRSGFVNVSVLGARAFLNGIEVFEIWNDSAPNPAAKKPRTALIVGSVLGGIVAGILIAALLVFKCRSAKIDRSSRLFSGSQGSSTVPKIPPNVSLKISFAEIQKATGNFDEEFALGEGGFGKVYRGILDGVKVAVKRSKAGHGQGFAEFKTEILVLSRIRHRHLVSLIGYCDEGSEMILVYEFMENGTLRDHLYNSKDEPRSEFSWEKRLEICIGAARGLDYLHSDAAKGILHRDVKSTNILLDENLEARVADFGLSKTGIADDLADESYTIKGSFGYFDPEYVRSMNYTEKSDVYSFGVVLLEAVCARPAIFDLSEERRSVSLAKWGVTWHREGRLESVIDPSLVGEIGAESLRVFGDLAAKCLHESGAERPAMKDVVWDLSYALRLQQNAAKGENYDESTANVSLESAFPAIRRTAFGFGDDDSGTDLSGFSNTIRI